MCDEPQLPCRLPLQSLEISMCGFVVNLEVVSRLTSLNTLVLQVGLRAQNPIAYSCCPE
jgi:hypothetical protein